MYDFDLIKDAASLFGWPSIILALTGYALPPAHKSHGHPCPCPDGPGEDRFNYNNRRGDGDFHCRKCPDNRTTGDGFTLIMRIEGWDLPTTLKAVAEHIKAPELTQCAPKRPKPVAAPKPESGPDPRHNKRCRELWLAAKPIVPGDPAWLYLRNRGIQIHAPSTLRFHPDVYNWVAKRRFPALIALIHRPGLGYSLHLTFIRTTGRKSTVEPRKLFMTGSEMPRGCRVELAAFTCSVTLGVAEGLENALSALQETGLRLWATLCTTSLAKFEPPKGVTHLIIFADRDEDGAGQKAADALRDRLAVERPEITVEIRMPTLDDWNEDLMAGSRMAAE